MQRAAEPAVRREQISDAVLRLVGRDGLSAVTFAMVAQEAGVSVGMIQHYFADKRALLRLAHSRVTSRFDDWLERAAEDLSVAERLRAGLLQMLPLDERRAREMRVRVAFSAEAAFDPELAAFQAERQHVQRQRVARAIRVAQLCGESPANLDPDALALSLGALIGGLGLQMLIDPDRVTHDIAIETVDANLAPLCFGIGGEGDPPPDRDPGPRE